MINIGDPVRGTNRYTDERVNGELLEVENGYDGIKYATVSDPINGTIAVRLDDLRGPAPCRNLVADLDSEGYAKDSEQTRCRSCGRKVFGYPNDDRDWGTAWTHNYDSIPARFRS